MWQNSEKSEISFENKFLAKIFFQIHSKFSHRKFSFFKVSISVQSSAVESSQVHEDDSNPPFG